MVFAEPATSKEKKSFRFFADSSTVFVSADMDSICTYDKSVGFGALTEFLGHFGTTTKLRI